MMKHVKNEIDCTCQPFYYKWNFCSLLFILFGPLEVFLMPITHQSITYFTS